MAIHSRWYKKKYGKKFRFFFRAGYRKGQHIKVKGRALTPLEHFCTRGFQEGRQLRMKTAVGVFDGTVDVEAFLEVSYRKTGMFGSTYMFSVVEWEAVRWATGLPSLQGHRMGGQGSGIGSRRYAGGIASKTSSRVSSCPEDGDNMWWARLNSKLWMMNTILDWAGRSDCNTYYSSSLPGNGRYYRCW